MVPTVALTVIAALGLAGCAEIKDGVHRTAQELDRVFGQLQADDVDMDTAPASVADPPPTTAASISTATVAATTSITVADKTAPSGTDTEADTDTDTDAAARTDGRALVAVPITATPDG
ncbi:MAG: hypothetical protein D6826_07825, partial [Alphaproteobacteria bacterium]